MKLFVAFYLAAARPLVAEDPNAESDEVSPSEGSASKPEELASPPMAELAANSNPPGGAAVAVAAAVADASAPPRMLAFSTTPMKCLTPGVSPFRGYTRR